MIQRSFAILLLAAGLASATTIVANVDWSRGEAIWINENGQPNHTYFSGVLIINLDVNGSEYTRDTLCVDLFTNIGVGAAYNTILLRPDQVPGRNLERVSWLVDNALLPTQGTVLPTAMAPEDWVRTPAQGAGIQLAIWDIVENGGDGLYTGSVQADPLTDSDALNWAIFYESASEGHTSDLAFVYDNFSLDSGARAQMLAGPRFDDGPQPNPEPATFALSGAAMIAGLYLARRRRRAR
jgi:hypothetical protein